MATVVGDEVVEAGGEVGGHQLFSKHVGWLVEVTVG